MAGIRLVSLNAYMLLYEERTRAFLESEDAAVFCLQEIPEDRHQDVARWCRAASHVFAPVTYQKHRDKDQVIGIGVYTQVPSQLRILHYDKKEGDVPHSDSSDPSTLDQRNGPIILCDMYAGEEFYRFATLHFTWTPDGQASDLQRTHLLKLLTILSDLDELVLTGDFNAPRGGEIWKQIAARYKDNVPIEYKTSLDPELHRAGHLERMVDGVFSTPGYRVSDVSMVSGVSDHQALSASIERHAIST